MTVNNVMREEPPVAYLVIGSVFLVVAYLVYLIVASVRSLVALPRRLYRHVVAWQKRQI